MTTPTPNVVADTYRAARGNDDLMSEYFARLLTGAVPSATVTPANVLVGFQSFTATTAATTVLTVPAGRTWVGTLNISASVTNAAVNAVQGQARAVVTTAGAGVTPAAGTIAAVEARAGANAATGTVGTQGNAHINVNAVVVAPAGNAVQIQVTTTIAGTAGVVDISANGSLQ